MTSLVIPWMARVLVAGHVHPGHPRPVDPREDVGQRTVGRASARGDVRDLECGPAPLGDGERLVEGLDRLEVAIAGVDRDQPVAARGRRGEADQLVGRGPRAERILEPDRQPEGALVDRRVEAVDHGRDLRLRRLARRQAEDRDAERVVPGERGDVDGRVRSLDGREVLAERGPWRRQARQVAERQVGERGG